MKPGEGERRGRRGKSSKKGDVGKIKKMGKKCLEVGENSLLETILNGVYSRPTARFFASVVTSR
jgi:hypothetical protein